MGFQLIKRVTPLLERVLRVTLLILVSINGFAQSVQLTPEQQMMLNQLPSADLSPAVAAEPKGEMQRAGASNRFIVEFTPKESLSARELEDLEQDPALSRIVGSQFCAGRQRCVVDLENIVQGGDNRELIGDIELREGDRLLVPKTSQEVIVIGQTQRNASHLYQPGLTQQDYFDLSGGLTRRADKKLIYVVRASGAIVTNSRFRWLGRGKGVEIRPGDTPWRYDCRAARDRQEPTTGIMDQRDANPVSGSDCVGSSG